MGSLFRLIPFVMVLFGSGGCQRSEPEAPSMMHQVLGALQIPDKLERDSELASACLQCAIVGDAESVLLGIPRIEDETLRDDVAEDCVPMLVSAAKKEAAKKVVELITDPAKRDELAGTLTAE